MDNTVTQKNSFYNTFTPFISTVTKTAEKTLKLGNDLPIHHKTDKSFSVFKDLSVNGLLLIPVMFLLVSRSNLNKMKKSLDRDYFLAVNNKIPGGFLNGAAKYFRIFKSKVVDGVSDLITPISDKKDAFFRKLYEQNNKTFLSKTVKNINMFFVNQKLSAVNKQSKKVKKLFTKIEANLEKQLEIIEASANGKVKVLLPVSVRKNVADELPKTIDFSKTADGKNRAHEIRKAIAEIKEILKQKNSFSPALSNRISHSCEDIFQEANDILMSIFIDLRKNSPNYKITRPIIKDIYEDLIRYRYAEVVKKGSDFSSAMNRKIHLTNTMTKIKILKNQLGGKSSADVYIAELEKLIKNAPNPENIGLLEKIRILLKCDDIKYEHVKDGKIPSLFKHYQPDEYICTKKLLNDFTKELNFLTETHKNIVPATLKEINNGKLYTHALATILPATVMTGKCITSNDEVKKAKRKRNLFSFLAGSAVMLVTYNIAIASILKSVAYGAFAAFGTSKIYDKIKN